MCDIFIQLQSIFQFLHQTEVTLSDLTTCKMTYGVIFWGEIKKKLSRKYIDLEICRCCASEGIWDLWGLKGISISEGLGDVKV